MINLKEFINNNDEVHTYAFQQAIDLGSSRGGETVFVPFGEYVLGTVVLKDNTNIMFEDGVKIRSIDNLDDFAKDEELNYPLYQDLTHSKYTKAMFFANKVENVKISGNASIDMLSLWDKENKRAKDGYYRGAKVFALRKVTNLKIYDLTIKNATDASILMGACKNVFISKVHIDSHIDGISPDGCENVFISDCIINTGDDALVLKSSYFDNCLHDCANINVNNCVMSSRANAIKLGTETNGDFKYINISNCVVYNTQHSGIAIQSVDGANIYGVNVTNVTMKNVANPIFIYLADRLRGPKGSKMGSISNVNISNIYADVHDQKFECNDSWCPNDETVIGCGLMRGYGINRSYTSVIMSTSRENKIKNVTLSNVNLTVLGGGKNDKLVLPNSKGYPECSHFALPAYGLYAKNTENLTLNNVNYRALTPDERLAEIV